MAKELRVVIARADLVTVVKIWDVYTVCPAKLPDGFISRVFTDNLFDDYYWRFYQAISSNDLKQILSHK
jgi:hypothetical protein